MFWTVLISSMAINQCCSCSLYTVVRLAIQVQIFKLLSYCWILSRLVIGGAVNDYVSIYTFTRKLRPGNKRRFVRWHSSPIVAFCFVHAFPAMLSIRRWSVSVYLPAFCWGGLICSSCEKLWHSFGIILLAFVRVLVCFSPYSLVLSLSLSALLSLAVRCSTRGGHHSRGASVFDLGALQERPASQPRYGQS